MDQKVNHFLSNNIYILTCFIYYCKDNYIFKFLFIFVLNNDVTLQYEVNIWFIR